MRKSTVYLVNSLKEKLLEFPKIVNKLERKELDFIQKLLLWINSIEEILTSNNISSVSELSGIKSKIIATKFNDDRKNNLKKLQLRAAADSLFDIQEVVLKVLTPKEIKVEESRELIRQLLLIVSQIGAIKYNKNHPFEDLINEIWQFISSNDQLKPGAVKLKTSFTITDIQMLIAEEINLEDFE